mmetsp:Transcript_54275/g.116586  ORF Transcript_54275/g.116586 Transcript_54275/m.116586 type:complete len:215 (-) Transcript_54275:20-664(-)
MLGLRALLLAAFLGSAVCIGPSTVDPAAVAGDCAADEPALALLQAGAKPKVEAGKVRPALLAKVNESEVPHGGDTGGTCFPFIPCDVSRGMTVCIDNTCYCTAGYYAKDGKCFFGTAPPTADTGGTCGVFGHCDESRGPTECKDEKCMCTAGYYAKDGVCILYDPTLVKDTGGTCSLFGDCDDSRGPTDCDDGKCICKAGYYAKDGECLPITKR